VEVFMSSYISQKIDETQKETFNHTLSQEVYRRREEDRENHQKSQAILENLRRILPLPSNAYLETISNICYPTHELVGASFKEKETGKIYVAEKVCLQFYGGWYFGILLNCGGSHTFLDFENYSC